MLAHLLLVLVVMTQSGPVKVAIKFPMPSIQSCEAYMADPTPILTVNTVGGEATCVNEPTDKGKPI